MKAAVDAAHALGKRIAIHSYGPNGGRDAVRAGTNTLEHSVDLDDATLALMVKQGTIYVPTIDHNRYYADFRADYGYTDDQARGLDAFRARNTESARRAIKAGVKVAMGSDAVHMMFGQNTRELGLLVQAGMTPLGALRAATITGAEVLGMQDRIGRVARGYYADIAAVEGNPATDVNATIYGVKWVMKGGKVVVDKRAAPAPPPSEPARATPSLDYAIGADLSFLADAEAKGVQFKDANRVLPGLQLFRDHGYNWIRLRVFHTVANSPMVLPNDLPYTLALAQKAKALGYKFLLDFHYSDTWADPQHQIIPRAWENLSDSALATAVEDYSRRTIAALREGGALPDMVQVGNEITVGMMWPRARLPQNWDLFCDLLKAGIRGIDEGRGGAPRPLIMIHIDQGGNRDATQWFFDNVMQRGVEFDVIGQSYYPFWHGTLLDLRENLRLTAERYRKPIVVVETAYSWRPSNYITAAGPFPETPAGQRDFLEAVNEAVLATPYGLGRGVMWWEPAVSDPSLVGRGMFDADHNALPVITVFDKYTRGKPARQ
jgi:arabinogalactan endo-1,4-beta-galactosidase